MILSYSDTRFPTLIEKGVKIHTLRDDFHVRWKAGNTIQHWMHNPRVVIKNPFQFCKGKFNVCKSVQKVTLICMRFKNPTTYFGVTVFVDNKQLTDDQCKLLVINDGFEDVSDFIDWFFPGLVYDAEIRRLKLIHWTDKKY